MTTDLEVAEPLMGMYPKALGGLPYLGDFSRLAAAIAKTEMVPTVLRGRADGVLAVVMAGFELGIGPMQALQSINLIQGKPSVSPELMRALIMQAGHQIIVEATNESATARCHRQGWPKDQWSEFTWTMVDAKQAGLLRTNDGTWSKYPRAMLTARVTSEAARSVFPDVIAGLSFVPEEVEEFTPVPAGGLSVPGEVSVDADEGEGVDLAAEEAMHTLVGLIKDMPEADRAEMQTTLREKFGLAQQMTLEDIRAAIEMVNEWADSEPTADEEDLIAARVTLLEMVRQVSPAAERDKLLDHLKERFGPPAERNAEQVAEALAVARAWPAEP